MLSTTPFIVVGSKGTAVPVNLMSLEKHGLQFGKNRIPWNSKNPSPAAKDVVAWVSERGKPVEIHLRDQSIARGIIRALSPVTWQKNGKQYSGTAFLPSAWQIADDQPQYVAVDCPDWPYGVVERQSLGGRNMHLVATLDFSKAVARVFPHVDAVSASPEAGSKWTSEEMQTSVDAYIRMLRQEQKGRAFSKTEEIRKLQTGSLSARTKASIDYLMRNISAVLEEYSLPIIKGYPPGKNVGSYGTNEILVALEKSSALTRADYKATPPGPVLDERVKRLQAHKLANPPPGQAQPKAITSERTEYFRDPAVKAWVLQNAKGICELCDKRAPFITGDGSPFLEHHHVTPLGEGGSDTVANSVVLCPNCHRECHLSIDRKKTRNVLYSKVARLRR